MPLSLDIQQDASKSSHSAMAHEKQVWLEIKWTDCDLCYPIVDLEGSRNIDFSWEEHQTVHRAVNTSLESAG